MSKSIGKEKPIGIYGTFDKINESTFNKLGIEFGVPEIYDEVTLYYTGEKSIKVRINSSGLYLSKKIKTGEDSSEEKIYLKLKPEQAKDFLETLKLMGSNKAVILNSTVYKYNRSNRELVLRFDNKKGNTWKISSKALVENILKEKEEIKDNLNKLGLNILNNLDKNPDEEITEVFKNGNLNETISLVIQKYMSRNIDTRGLSISESLQFISNDYSEHEDMFQKIIKKELLSKTPLEYPHDFFLKTSIIIPAYNNYEQLGVCLKSISNQKLSESQFNTIEVIVVDDGSSLRGIESIYGTLKEIIESKGMIFNYIRSFNNNGRSITRNLGLQAAKGDIIVFLDADVVIDKNYITETVVRHQHFDKIMLISFKENIDINNNTALNTIGSQIRKVKWENDFRIKKTIKKGWIGLHSCKMGETIQCLINSNYFKDFGFGRLIGPFNLQGMVVTHNLSAKRKELIKIGGFREEFKKWGYEDACLGAELICTGNYLIPMVSTGVFHLENNYLSEENNKMKEISTNYNIYKNILNYVK